MENKLKHRYPINIWINEERFEKLKKAGIEKFTQEVLAGMKVLKVECSEEQKNRILILFPGAKFDSATIHSIELIPPKAKDRLFNLILNMRSLNVVEEFLASMSKK